MKISNPIPLSKDGFDTVIGDVISFEDAYLLVNDVKISFKVTIAEGDLLRELNLIIESDKEVYLVDKRVPGISKTL